MAYILVLCLAQSMVTTYLLASIKQNKGAERYLWYILALLSLHFSIKFLLLVVFQQEELFDRFATPLTFGYGPLIFFYAYQIIRGTSLNKKSQLIHLVPLTFFTVEYLVVGLYLFVYQDNRWLTGHYQLVRFGGVFSVLSYHLYLIFFLYSNTVLFGRLRWLGINLVLSVCSLSLYIAVVLVDGEAAAYWPKQLVLIGTLVLVISVLKNAVQNQAKPNEFGLSTSQIAPAVVLELGTEKVQRSQLSKEKAEKYASELERVMRTEKLYLNPELSLAALASRLKISAHLLSELLNNHLDTNFFLFVNAFRIEEAKRRLDSTSSPGNLLILGAQCGFNSKTTFIKYFKQLEGLTPSQYAEHLRRQTL